jgi:hypothetical protein
MESREWNNYDHGYEKDKERVWIYGYRYSNLANILDRKVQLPLCYLCGIIEWILMGLVVLGFLK